VRITRREFAVATASLLATRAAEPDFTKSICSVIFPPGTAVARMFVLAKAAGFSAVELRLDVDLLESGNVRSLAQDNGIEIASLWVSQALAQHPLNSPDAAIRAKGVDDIRRACDIAAVVHCGALLLVPGRVTPVTGYEETWKRITEELTKCLPVAESNRVLLTVENVWNKFLLSPLEMRTFVDRFHSPWLAAHFDIGNVMQFGYPEDWIRTLGSRIRRVHVKDYKVSTRAEQGRFMPLFEGDVNFAGVMRALREVNYSGYLSPEIEYDPGQPDQLGNVSRQLDRILTLA
jgi:hexulose-6-phosphate isomerase